MFKASSTNDNLMCLRLDTDWSVYVNGRTMRRRSDRYACQSAAFQDPPGERTVSAYLSEMKAWVRWRKHGHCKPLSEHSAPGRTRGGHRVTTGLVPVRARSAPGLHTYRALQRPRCLRAAAVARRRSALGEARLIHCPFLLSLCPPLPEGREAT